MPNVIAIGNGICGNGAGKRNLWLESRPNFNVLLSEATLRGVDATKTPAVGMCEMVIKRDVIAPLQYSLHRRCLDVIRSQRISSSLR